MLIESKTDITTKFLRIHEEVCKLASKKWWRNHLTPDDYPSAKSTVSIIAIFSFKPITDIHAQWYDFEFCMVSFSFTPEQLSDLL